MKKFLLLLLFTALLASACKTSQGTTSSNLTNTRWTYKDDDLTYEITFKKGGVLSSTNPNDVTPNNDSWEQSGNNVTFWFNDKYSTYTGVRKGNTIAGTGKNSTDSWTFTMTRMR